MAEKEKLFRNLGISGRDRLKVLLTPESSIGNWKALAEKMGFTIEEIDYFATKSEPVEVILRDWSKKQGQEATLSKLQELIRAIGRVDVLEDLQKFIDEIPDPSEDNQNNLTKGAVVNGSRAIEGEYENVTVYNGIYDALICYADKDVELAMEIVRLLEAPPYNFKICINYRDFGVGGDHLTQLATIIEERVKRIIVILTSNFINCEECDYQAKVAMTLSPGCRQKRVVPILYEENLDIPRFLKHVTSLNKARKEVQPYFVKRLTTSLGYTNNEASLEQKQEKPCAAPSGKIEIIEKELRLKEHVKSDEEVSGESSDEKVQTKDEKTLLVRMVKGKLKGKKKKS